MNPSPGIVPVRDALYYPYAHIKDPDWLKATLLYFGQVQRIHPRGYPSLQHLEAPLEAFKATQGVRGPLLHDIGLWTEGMGAAMGRLLHLLEQHEPEVRARFGKPVAEPVVLADPSIALIHELKLQPLLDFLTAPKPEPLAWSFEGFDPGTGWFALHPDLTRAVMSTLAVGIARGSGLDIVTDEPTVHNIVTASSEAEIFEQLMRGSLAPPALHGGNAADATDDLGHFFMLHCVDVEKLGVEEIAELSSEKSSLAAFRQQVAELARDIPPMEDPEAYRKRLKEKAGDLVSDWEKGDPGLPRRASKALLEAAGVSSPAWVTGLLAGSAGGFMLAAGAVLAVGYVTVKGWNIIQDLKQADPYPYLSKIRAAGGEVEAPAESVLTFPSQGAAGTMRRSGSKVSRPVRGRQKCER